MAIQATYKKYKRGQRQALIESDFTKGMMYSEGSIPDGYVKNLVNFDYTSDGKNVLKPRAALVTKEILVPDMLTDLGANTSAYLDEDMVLKYVQECSENGVSYRQLILGKPNIVNDEPTSSGKIFVVTSEKTDVEWEDLKIEGTLVSATPSTCSFYNTDLTKIHGKSLVPAAKAAFPVGTFMGNSFYFFSAPSGGTLKKTVFNYNSLAPASSRYEFNTVPVKNPSASEAVNYGYNMLEGSESAVYTFADGTLGATPFIMEGILPYDKASSDNTRKLLMTPKANTRVWFQCNYKIPTGNTYNIIWSWKELTADEWTVFGNTSNFTATNPLSKLEASLIAPAKEIMIRCEAYNTLDTTVVETAMTVGFDFSIPSDSSTVNVKPEYYDLSTATGMISWKNRLVLWGVPKDPTILFISDLEEPGYFPYPNNITVLDEPIIAVTELMDNLVVFTKSKVYQIVLNEDGNSWTSTVIQSNLYIEPWDKHLIQTIRNMVYFKSGNYYYMIVPKAQSTTGELTLAPITTPITDFFNYFQSNVDQIFKDCFKTEDGEEHIPTDLITYYNFVDYEYVHNFYVYAYNGFYVHFDIVYNVVNRYWKICIYESSHFLFPFRNDATQQGLLAGSTVVNVHDVATNTDSDRKCFQLLGFDSLRIKDLYIVEGTTFICDTTYSDAGYNSEVITIQEPAFTYSNEIAYVPSSRGVVFPDDELLVILDGSTYVYGFNVLLLKETLETMADTLDAITVFPNRQMLDTGYRDSNIFLNKRYRELQLQINNIDNCDMEFGMDFKISGEPRNIDYLYEVSQVIDEFRQDEGIVYIDATPYLPIPYIEEFDDEIIRAGEIKKVNCWTLKHSLDSDISLWKVRASISGKGAAPRLRMFTKAAFNYQLLSVNWVYREMNMR